MAYPWFKFYHQDFLTEKKLKGVDADRRSCLLTALCYAALEEGTIDTKYVTSDVIKIESGVPMGGDRWDSIEDIFQWLHDRDFGEITGQTFTFKAWQKRQESHLTGAERVKKHREKPNVTDVTLDKNRVEENRTDTQFDQLWKEYPKKVGKETARIAFKKLKPSEELTAKISASIARFKKTDQWKDNEGRYIPHFSTFLNQQRFEDEVFESKGPVPIRYERTEKGMRPIYEEDYKKLPASEFAKGLGSEKRITNQQS